ncbi:hypothetical protein BCR37DRAFT_280840 [Protomyces lactucae-debilis]|uniref:Dolichyldiphosphatase n=1 Tax=Protomyces lactucae-debilis TaxID=2754530 RepID=A0A1Y2FKT3_PROLT|nr:uncharacterized protein BCR37DRAFT_280840 [Protomyces lactucae-debilis]ORY83816.1 hypothetical protein BCR37DRAFT_280840 [Protomyces lactucae-debilis]
MGALASPADNLASLALTHVYYDPDSSFGLLSAFLALIPQALLVAYATALYCRREAEIAWLFAGQLACEALNWISKRAIKQDRPQHVIGIGKGYGMPSSHAQFMGFFCVYASCILLLRHRQRLATTDIQRWRDWIHGIRAGTVVSVSFAVCLSRIYLAYHTVAQVLVGVGIGMVFGGIWFMVYEQLKQAGVVRWLCETQVAAVFLVRDTEYETEVEQEWQRWRQAIQAEVHGRKKKR